MSPNCLSEKTLSPVDYCPLVFARRFPLPPLDSDSGAQSMWRFPFLTGIRIMEMNIPPQVQEVPNLSGVLGWWNCFKRYFVYIIIVIYPRVCFCIFMWLNFYVGAKFKNGPYKNQGRNCVVVHCKSKHPVPRSQACTVLVITRIMEGLLGWMCWSTVPLFRNRHISMLHYRCSGKAFVSSINMPKNKLCGILPLTTFKSFLLPFPLLTENLCAFYSAHHSYTCNKSYHFRWISSSSCHATTFPVEN